MNVFLIIILSFLGLTSHDIQLAIYKIHKQEDNLLIEYSFEKEDIILTLNESELELSNKTIQEYINSNFKLSLNNQLQAIDFHNMVIEDKHIYLKGYISNITSNIESLKIENTCLLNIEGHSNIIEVLLEEKQRDFLMNNRRTSIEINY